MFSIADLHGPVRAARERAPRVQQVRVAGRARRDELGEPALVEHQHGLLAEREPQVGDLGRARQAVVPRAEERARELGRVLVGLERVERLREGRDAEAAGL